MDKTTIAVFFLFGLFSLWLLMGMESLQQVVFVLLVLMALAIGAAAGAENSAYIYGFSAKLKQGEKPKFGKVIE